MDSSKFKHDIKNCIVSLETIALNLKEGLYTEDQAVDSILSLKEEISEVLNSYLETQNDG